MKSIVSIEPGGPEVLELMEMPFKSLKPIEVRISVKAAGISFPDTLIIRDKYQFRPKRPFAPESEVAGFISEVGTDVEGVSIGNRVVASGIFGGYSTEFICSEAKVTIIPDMMPFNEAAAFMVTYGTSYYALKIRANLKPGETLLILGASGGVGSAAIEIGKALGAKIIAAVSSSKKAKFCKGLGADETIIYPESLSGREAQRTFLQTVRMVAGKQGINVVYDAVGGDYSEPALRSLAWEGRFLVVGFPAGIAKIPLNLLLLKSCQMLGVFWGESIELDPEENENSIKQLFRMYEEGKISPKISKEFALSSAQQALEL